MPMYRISHPWDYHESGAVIVNADNPERALELATLFVAKNNPYKLTTPFGEIKLVSDGITEDGGCDC